jgi:hypothetical protein
VESARNERGLDPQVQDRGRVILDGGAVGFSGHEPMVVDLADDGKTSAAAIPLPHQGLLELLRRGEGDIEICRLHRRRLRRRRGR